MILSDRDILDRLADGELVIEPLDDIDLQVQPASVDLRLGREFLEFRRTNIPCIHPRSEREVDEYVSETVAEGEFVLHPGDFVLGTTVERVEIPPDLIAHVEGRSSLGRLAVVVHASLPADEEVFLWTPEEGYGLYPIGEIVEAEREARAVSFDPATLRVRTHRITDHITNPAKRIFRVRLESGREVRVTRDHNLFTVDDTGHVVRVPSEEAVGTLVMVPEDLPSSPSSRDVIDVDTLLDATPPAFASDGGGRTVAEPRPDGIDLRHSDRYLPRELPLDRELGWGLGFVIGSGSVDRERIVVRDAAPRERDRLRTVFGIHESVAATHRSSPSVTIDSPIWTPVLRAILREDEPIPEQAFEWPPAVVSGLLRGLCAGTPGGTRTVEVDGRSTASRVAYLADRIRRRPSVTVPADDAGDRERWGVELRERAPVARTRVPCPGELLRRLRHAAGFDRREAASAIGNLAPSRLAVLEAGLTETVSVGTLHRLRDAYADAGAQTARLDRLLDGGIRFERVSTVQPTDRVERTYDLEVQPAGRPVENFLGGTGGVFLSNTAGLCDPGYKGQITLELSNLGTAPVALEPGMRVSQLTFTELTTPAERPYGSERGSKYQNQSGPQASRVQSDPEFEQ